jgi:hypothetical protein
MSEGMPQVSMCPSRYVEQVERARTNNQHDSQNLKTIGMMSALCSERKHRNITAVNKSITKEV